MPKKITSVVWEATGLPSGLSLDKGSGILSGTPTANSGEYHVPVKVTTNYGTDKKDMIVEIKAGAPKPNDEGEIQIGLMNVSVGETVYIPLSLFGWRNVTPSNDITITDVSFYGDKYGTNYLGDSVGNLNAAGYGVQYFLTIDKSTGNIVFTRGNSYAGGRSAYFTLSTNHGRIEELQRMWLQTDNSLSLYTSKSIKKIGTLTTTNYRENKIYA